MGLCPAHDDPVRPFLDHVEVHVLVGLFARPEGTVALDVGDARVRGQIVLLHVFQELGEPVVIIRLYFLSMS